jgi:hypothetical protein
MPEQLQEAVKRARNEARQAIEGMDDDVRLVATRFGTLALVTLALWILAEPFMGIVAFVAGLALLTAHAAAHPMPPRRPSGSGASTRRAPGAGRPGTRR